MALQVLPVSEEYGPYDAVRKHSIYQTIFATPLKQTFCFLPCGLRYLSLIFQLQIIPLLLRFVRRQSIQLIQIHSKNSLIIGALIRPVLRPKKPAIWYAPCGTKLVLSCSNYWKMLLANNPITSYNTSPWQKSTFCITLPLIFIIAEDAVKHTKPKFPIAWQGLLLL